MNTVQRLTELNARLDEAIHFNSTPSPEAVEALRETQKFNRWVSKQKDGMAATQSIDGQVRAMRVQAAVNKLHARLIANKGSLPWGKKAQGRKAYANDMEWLNQNIQSNPK